ncbi:MAG: hypothetical protein MJZ37_08475 [Bacilli bacterium]|nr:hypothetical protein [Bacilli bacterium]
MPYIIANELEDMQDNDLKINTTYGDNISVTIDGKAVRDYLMAKYARYKVMQPLKNLWEMYIYYTDKDLSRMLDAYLADYNPIDNYNGVEKHIHIKDDGDEITDRLPDENENYVENVATPDQMSELFATTDEDAAERLESKTKNTGGTKTIDHMKLTQKSYHGEHSFTFEGETYTSDIVEIDKIEKHGNLGVTQTQQMISNEMELRAHNVFMMYIDNFIEDYAYYVGGKCFDYLSC